MSLKLHRPAYNNCYVCSHSRRALTRGALATAHQDSLMRFHFGWCTLVPTYFLGLGSLLITTSRESLVSGAFDLPDSCVEGSTFYVRLRATA
jgi:hypothetical protein